MKPRLVARRPRILRALLSRSALPKLVLLLLVWTIIEAHVIYYRVARAELESAALAVLSAPARVYIASLHWNNEEILRSHWNGAVVDLVKALGPDNVFVSVYESGSWDDSKGALRELDKALAETGVGRRIVLDEETHADVIAGPPGRDGWITVPDGSQAPRRIPYLSRLRNLSLQPLQELAENGTTFDHVLFLGDVIFTVRDVIALLKTNHGRYAAACSLDFSKPPAFYDTFALRDAAGHEYATQSWPYFRASESRRAVLRGEPAPVSSCWNGIVAMPASTFTGSRPLAFRGIPDSLAAAHLEGSECCLVHADNPASRSRGVFVNPAVRVGYKREAYDAVHPTPKRSGRGGVGAGAGIGASGTWLSLSDVYFGLWKNRLARWLTTPWFKEREVLRRIRRWERAGSGAGTAAGGGADGVKEAAQRREEKGWFCLINEMQILVRNGWKHL